MEEEEEGERRMVEGALKSSGTEAMELGAEGEKDGG